MSSQQPLVDIGPSLGSMCWLPCLQHFACVSAVRATSHVSTVLTALHVLVALIGIARFSRKDLYAYFSLARCRWSI